MPDLMKAKPANAPAAPVASAASASRRIVFHWATAAPTLSGGFRYGLSVPPAGPP